MEHILNRAPLSGGGSFGSYFKTRLKTYIYIYIYTYIHTHNVPKNGPDLKIRFKGPLKPTYAQTY